MISNLFNILTFVRLTVTFTLLLIIVGGYYYIQRLQKRIENNKNTEMQYRAILYSKDDVIVSLRRDIEARDNLHKEQSKLITDIINNKEEIKEILERKSSAMVVKKPLAKLSVKKPDLIGKILTEGYNIYMKCMQNVSQNDQSAIKEYCFYNKKRHNYFAVSK